MKRNKIRFYIAIFVVVIALWRLFSAKEVKLDEKALLADFTEQKLNVTRHADCRMDCRLISQEDVDYLIENGRVNYQKSRLYDEPCPTYALEGRPPGSTMLRIVVADCEPANKLVTVIDLEKNHRCNCN